MKPIKFRAFYRRDSIMIPVTKLYFDSKQVLTGIESTALKGGLIFKHISLVELMQFTGMLDCNGKEIYEGDIIEYFDIPSSCALIKPLGKDMNPICTREYKYIYSAKSYIIYYYPIYGIVKWNEEFLLFDPSVTYDGDIFSALAIINISYKRRTDEDSYVKVLGNIYENPELIKELKL
jgi:hypothetical protein